MAKKNVIETKTFVEGEKIYSHNELSDFIYLIESGEVKILSKNGWNWSFRMKVKCW